MMRLLRETWRTWYRLIAQDLKDGTHSAPDFENAVAIHRVLNVIDQSAKTSVRVLVG